MTHDTLPAYGLWGLVIINTAVFVIFAFSFTKPKTSRDWRSFGAFSAFIVALFTEMYGFPLTIYLLSGWLTRTYPGIDPFSHDAGHLWSTLFGLHGNPHWSVLHLLSIAAIFGGFILLSAAWKVLYDGWHGSRSGKRCRSLVTNTRLICSGCQGSCLASAGAAESTREKTGQRRYCVGFGARPSRSCRIGHSGRSSPSHLSASSWTASLTVDIAAIFAVISATWSSASRLTSRLARLLSCQRSSSRRMRSIEKPRSRARLMKRRT